MTAIVVDSALVMVALGVILAVVAALATARAAAKQ